MACLRPIKPGKCVFNTRFMPNLGGLHCDVLTSYKSGMKTLFPHTLGLYEKGRPLNVLLVSVLLLCLIPSFLNPWSIHRLHAVPDVHVHSAVYRAPELTSLSWPRGFSPAPSLIFPLSETRKCDFSCLLAFSIPGSNSAAAPETNARNSFLGLVFLCNVI